MLDAAGGNVHRVPELADLASPVESFWWSPNGSWVVYSTTEDVWKIPTGGGTPVKLGIVGGLPDFEGKGAVVLQTPWIEQGRFRIVPLDGGEASVLFGFDPAGPAFSYGSKGIYYLPARRPGELMLYRLPSGQVSTVVAAAAACLCGMSLSPNGGSLLFSKFVSKGADLVFVEHFK
jgi:hypothetical protein